MKAIKEGYIVKFHTPLADENPNQLYVVLEVIEDVHRSRVEIQALNTGLPFPPINTVSISDLEVVEVNTNELIGHKVTINKSDFTTVEGRVVKANEEKVELKLSSTVDGVKTNVWIIIVDNDGIEHLGTLLINQD